MSDPALMTIDQFTLALVRACPFAKVAPKDRPEQATRDVAKITSWMTAGEELAFVGFRLRSKP